MFKTIDTAFFQTELPPRPMGRYAHIITLRVTEGYALFQTDGELNKARVSSGSADETAMTRITLFKRKQTTPERLTGREMLRNYGLLSSSEDEKDADSCIYNVKSCRKCPDCITYGFAIGDGGSEKSKVYSDTAFSLTDYASSHEVFTLNAPYEDGNMSDHGAVSSRINQQDHVKPQTIFPSVITTRDLTWPLFAYVLSNILRTTRYGATTTRGGTMQNHVVAVVLNNGEIFSNLLFAQRMYDVLRPTPNDPVKISDALKAANTVIPALLKEDNVSESDTHVVMGDELAQLLVDMRLDEAGVRDMLTHANTHSVAYYNAYVAKKK